MKITFFLLSKILLKSGQLLVVTPELIQSKFFLSIYYYYYLTFFLMSLIAYLINHFFRGLNKCPDANCSRGTLTQGWGSGSCYLPYLVTVRIINELFFHTIESIILRLSYPFIEHLYYCIYSPSMVLPTV